MPVRRDVTSMTMRRANYATVDFEEYLGHDDGALSVPWADYVGNASTEHAFEVPTDDPTDAYVELQVYDVDEYGHEILVNGDPLSGFDIPPHNGWQQWMDTVTGASLRGGENTIRIRRDPDTPDNFVVGTVVIHWREPVET